MKVLVTGGCGFLGSHTCEFYAERGDQVVSFDNMTKYELARTGYGSDLARDYNWNYLSSLGVVYLEDPESGAVFPVDTSSRKVREAFEREVKQRRSDREGLFRKLRVDYINLSTEDTDLASLVNFFRIRAKRARRG